MGSVEKVFKTGKPDSYEISSNIPKIGTIWFSTKIVPLKHGTETVMVITVSTNITEQKQMNEKLKESEEKFSMLFECAPEPFSLHDTEGRFIDINKTCEELLGYKKEEMIGKNFQELNLLSKFEVQRTFSDTVGGLLGKSIGTGRFILNRKDGTKMIVETRAIPVKIKNQTMVFLIERDITKQQRMEEELKERNKELENFNKLTMGREEKILELKERIIELEERLKDKK